MRPQVSRSGSAFRWFGRPAVGRRCVVGDPLTAADVLFQSLIGPRVQRVPAIVLLPEPSQVLQDRVVVRDDTIFGEVSPFLILHAVLNGDFVLRSKRT
jgi:hypothetical protein